MENSARRCKYTNWRMDATQRTRTHVSIYAMRLVNAGMWYLGTLWKLPLPVSAGFKYWLAARHRHTRQRIEEIRSQAAINSSWRFVSRASGLGARRRRWKKYSPVTRAAASSLTASHA
jgi:hypothetical protein